MTKSLDIAPRRAATPSRYATFMSRRASLMPTFAAVAILLVLLISAQARFPKFLSPGNMSALLLDNAYLVVLAVGPHVRDPHGRHRPLGGVGHGLHRHPRREPARPGHPGGRRGADQCSSPAP